MIPISQVRDKWREEGSERNQSGSQVIKKLGEHENKGEVCVYFSSLGLCTCEIFEFWVPQTTDVQVLWFLPRHPGDRCYFIFTKLLNSLNVNDTDLTVQECPHCCHDSRASNLSPVRHKLLHFFYVSATEFLTGPTVRAGWRSLRRLHRLPENSWRWDGAEGDSWWMSKPNYWHQTYDAHTKHQNKYLTVSLITDESFRVCGVEEEK